MSSPPPSQQSAGSNTLASRMPPAKPCLWMVPVPLLAPGMSDPAAAQAVLPAETLQVIHRLRHYVVENSKTARAILKPLVAPCPIQDIHLIEMNKHRQAQDWEAMLAPIKQGFDVGMLSESGCPGIADPGALLARQAHLKGIRVRPLVGPSSLLLALMAGGLGGQQFRFNGYLPSTAPERQKALIALEKSSQLAAQTEMFIETPYRNEALLMAASSALRPETLLSLALNLGLPDERILTLKAGQWRNHLQQHPDLASSVKAGMAVFSLLA